MKIQFLPLSIQIAFFLSTINLTSKIKIADAINRIHPDKFNIDPILIPVENNQAIPPDFPLLIMENKNTGWKIQLGQARLDLFIDPSTQSSYHNHDRLYADIIATGLNLYTQLSSQFTIQTYRMGFIISHTANHPSPIQHLQSKYLNITLDNSYEVRIEYLRKFTLQTFPINRWIRIRGIQGKSPQPSILFLENDINTDPDAGLIFTPDLIGTFLNLANQEIIETVEQYSKNE